MSTRLSHSLDCSALRHPRTLSLRTLPAMHWLSACLLLASANTALAQSGSTPPAADDLDAILAERPAEEPAPAPLDSIPVPALAAETAPTAAPADQPQAIDEIIVTAQKTAQSLQDVPVSVSVLDGETMRASGVFDAANIENLVANLEIDTDPQAPVIGIRGFFTETDNVGFEPSVGLVFDEVALGRSEFVPDGLFDMQRSEVLRGPQGTLFGKNTIAGVLSFTSTEPQDFAAADLYATLADPSESRIEGGLSLPLTDRLAARLSGLYWDRDGEIDNTKLDRREGGFEQRAGRIKFVVTPADGWTVRLSHQLNATDSDYPPWQLFDASDAALSFARNYDPAVEDDPRNARTSFNVPGFVQRDSNLSRAIAEYAQDRLWGLHDLTHTLVAGYAAFDVATDIDIDVSPADLLLTRFGVDYRQTSGEYRIAGSADSLFGLGEDLHFVIGAFALSAAIDSDLDTLAGRDLIPFALSEAGLQTLGIPLSGLLGPLLDALPPLLPGGVPIDDALFRGFAQDAQTRALFGQFDWHFTSRWALIAGLRIGSERKTADFDVHSEGIGLINAVVGAEPYTAHRVRNEREFSPKLGLQFDATDELTTYLTWTRGFKSGGFNATAETQTVEDESGNEADNLEFAAERAQSWEAGLKSRFFSRALTANLAVYRTDVDNLQVTDFTGFSYQVSNAAAARLQGVELDLRLRAPVPWFAMNASLAYSDAHYLRYADAPPTEAQQNAGQDSQDLSGRPLANAPRYTGVLSPQFSLPLGERLTASWTVDFSYRGDQYSATDLDPHSFQSGYWLYGSHLVLGANDGRWALILTGTNLADARSKDLVFDNSIYQDTYIAQQIPLRRIGLSLQASWY